MEAAKEDTISNYLPILDDISIQRFIPKEDGSHYISDLCILFILNYILIRINVWLILYSLKFKSYK